jgi:hypothetical protein
MAKKRVEAQRAVVKVHFRCAPGNAGMRRITDVPCARSRLALAASGLGGFAVEFGVRLGGFSGVVRRVMMVAVSDVRVMRGNVMIFFFMVPRSFAVMVRREFVMLGSLLVVLDCFGHLSSSRVFKSLGGLTG